MANLLRTAALFSLLAASTAFLAAPALRARPGGVSVAMLAQGEETCSRGTAVRTLGALAGLSFLAPLSAPQRVRAAAAAEEEEEEEAAEGGGQVVDLDEITFNPKKAAIVAGAFVFADVVSALLTGRSVLRIINGNEDPEDWKTKAVDKLLEKEKQEQAAKMGVSVTTNSGRKQPANSTGEYAKKDPFEIAKEKYKSVEDLKKSLKSRLEDD